MIFDISHQPNYHRTPALPNTDFRQYRSGVRELAVARAILNLREVEMACDRFFLRRGLPIPEVSKMPQFQGGHE